MQRAVFCYAVGGDANFIMESAETGNTKLPSDYFFTDDSGLVYDISSPDINNKTICFHDFSIHRTWNNHKKDEKGGCVVKSYDAFLCSKCSDVKVGELACKKWDWSGQTRVCQLIICIMPCVQKSSISITGRKKW